MTDYDGRVAQACMESCQEGECAWPRTTDGCGGCCGCLGPCFRGYEEQVAEEQSQANGSGVS